MGSQWCPRLGQWLCIHGANPVLLKNCVSLKIVGLVAVELAFLVVSFAVPCTREGAMHGPADGAALGNGCAFMGLIRFSFKIVFH